MGALITAVMMMAMWQQVMTPDSCLDPLCKQPIDVPAITKPRLVHKAGELWSCGQDLCQAGKNQYEKIWTCADKSRVLLTSEDGKKHCIKF